MQYINSCAFFESNFTNVKLPSTLKSIGSYSFYRCPIQNIEVPQNAQIDNIGSYAFTLLMHPNFSFPNGTKQISKFGFYGCVINNLEIPVTLTRMDNWSFVEITCENLVFQPGYNLVPECTFPFSDIQNYTFPKTLRNFSRYSFTSTAVKELEIFDNTYIGEAAFEDCRKIFNISIQTDTNIGKWAFSNCNATLNITTYGDFIADETSFINVTNVTIVHYGPHDIYVASTREGLRTVPKIVYVMCCYRSKYYASMKPNNFTECSPALSCISNRHDFYPVRYYGITALYLGLN